MYTTNGRETANKQTYEVPKSRHASASRDKWSKAQPDFFPRSPQVKLDLQRSAKENFLGCWMEIFLQVWCLSWHPTNTVKARSKRWR